MVWEVGSRRYKFRIVWQCNSAENRLLFSTVLLFRVSRFESSRPKAGPEIGPVFESFSEHTFHRPPKRFISRSEFWKGSIATSHFGACFWSRKIWTRIKNQPDLNPKFLFFLCFWQAVGEFQFFSICDSDKLGDIPFRRSYYCDKLLGNSYPRSGCWGIPLWKVLKVSLPLL